MTKILVVCLYSLFILFSRGSKLAAQNLTDEGSNVISGILEEVVASSDEDYDPSVLADELYHLIDHPLNLNTADEEALRDTHILTEFQIHSLLSYIREQGDLQSVYELQMIVGFDPPLISKLMPFVRVAPSFKSYEDTVVIKNYLHQMLIFKAVLDGEKKQGFMPDTSGNKAFLGSNRALLMRYEAEISRFTFGLTADQDAGESFHSNVKPSRPDFLSGFLTFDGKRFVKKIVIGDYRITCGQGLVLGGYGSRKGSQVLLSPATTGLKKYSSSGENDFFRGVATSLKWKNMNLDLFASHHRLDATLHTLETETDTLRYLNSPDLSGLHRYLPELEKKDAIISNSIGAHSQVSFKNISWGCTWLSEQYNRQWVRNSTAYSSEIFPAGNHFQNLSTDMKASMGKIALFGELAADTKFRIACFTGFLAEIHPLITLSLAYRNYQPDYLGIHASGFGESQGTKNEEGFYLGLQTYPWRFMKADFYADHYSFPFLRYNSTNPYSGVDYLLNTDLFITKEFTVSLRFRYEQNQNRSATCRTGIDRMQKAQKGNTRLEINYIPGKNLKLKSRVEFSYCQNAREPVSIGYYSGHDIGFTSNSQKINLWFRYAIFDIPGWDNRIYAYENDVMYNFTVPAFNSSGSRFILMAKIEIFRGVELNTRYAITRFRGLRITGSGFDKVSSVRDSGGTVQVIFKI